MTALTWAKNYYATNAKIAIVMIALVVTTYAAYAAKAQNSEGDVPASIGDTKISLSQAITAAQACVGRKAVRAEYEKKMIRPMTSKQLNQTACSMCW